MNLNVVIKLVYLMGCQHAKHFSTTFITPQIALFHNYAQLLVYSNYVRKHEQFIEKKHSSFLTEAERGPVSIKRGGNSWLN